MIHPRDPKLTGEPLREHLFAEHYVTSQDLKEIRGFIGTKLLHEQLHQKDELRCNDQGHFIFIGADRCDCGLERIVIP